MIDVFPQSFSLKLAAIFYSFYNVLQPVNKARSISLEPTGTAYTEMWKTNNMVMLT